MKRIIQILLIVCVSKMLVAQQLPLHEMYNQNLFLINPAEVSNLKTSQLTLFGRQQWTGVQGAPTTNSLLFNSKLKKGLSFGVKAAYDKIQFVNDFSTSLALGYKLKLGVNSYLSAGLQLGVLNRKLNFDGVVINDMTDDVLSGNNRSSFGFSSDFGLTYRYNQFFSGGYLSQLFGGNGTTFNTGLTSADQVVHYGLYAGYDFTKGSIVYSPILATRFLPSSNFQFDLGMKAMWNNKLWATLMYRMSETIGLHAGYQINQRFNVGYAYAYGVSGISNYSNGTHEIMINIAFGKVKVDAEDASVVDSLIMITNVLADKNKALDSLVKSNEARIKELEKKVVHYQDSVEILNLIEMALEKDYSNEDIEGGPIDDNIKLGERYVVDNIHFEFNSFIITEDSKLILDKVVEYLKARPSVRLEIDGYTDHIGSEGDNLILSINRARAVYLYLIANGINESRLKFNGFGEANPVATNATDKGRAENRRIEFILLAK